MKRKKHPPHNRERAAAHELHGSLEKAYREQASHNPHTAIAFASLAQVVPKLANASPGWSHHGLTRSMFRRGGRKAVH